MPGISNSRRRIESFLSGYKLLRDSLIGRTSISPLLAAARKEGISLDDAPRSPSFLKNGNAKRDNELPLSLKTLLNEEETRKEFIDHAAGYGKYLERTLAGLDLREEKNGPLALVLLELALAADRPIRELCGGLLKRIDPGRRPILYFFVLAVFREYLTLTWFSQRSRKSMDEVDGELMRSFRALLPGKRVRHKGKNRKNSPQITVGDGKTELSLSFEDDDISHLSRRMGFTFLLQNSISLYFMEDDQYREKNLVSLLGMTDQLFNAEKGVEDSDMVRYSFLRMVMLSSAGEDERSVEFYKHEIFDNEKFDMSDVYLGDLYFLGRCSLMAAEHALYYDPERANLFSAKSANWMLSCVNPKEVGLSLVTLSDSWRGLDNNPPALKAAVSAEELFDRLRFVLPLASARTSLAWVLLANEELKASEKKFTKAGRTFRKRGDTQGYIEALIGLLKINFSNDKRRKAKKILKNLALSLPVKQYPRLFSMLKEAVMENAWLREDRELGQMFERTRPVRLKKDLLKKIIAYAKDSHPNEFGAALTGKEVLTDLELLYSSTVNRTSVMFSKYDGAGSRITVDGFVHSHPSGAAIPSRADLRSFNLFVNNLIIGYPFTGDSIAAYDRVGNRLELEIVD